jgi:hypothetical protein
MLQEIFRRYDSQPGRVIAEINPILRGWVNDFRIGNAARCFAYVMNWVEKKVRRHLMRARNRPDFGWKRWSTVGLHEALGLFHDYRVQYGARTWKRSRADRSHNPCREADREAAYGKPLRGGGGWRRAHGEPTRARSWKRRIQPRGASGAPHQSSTLLCTRRDPWAERRSAGE